MPAAIGSVVGLILFNAGFSLAAVNFVTLTLVPAALQVGLSLAAGAVFSPRGGSAPTLKPSEGQIAIRQAVPPRMKSYGTVQLAGAINWFDTDAGVNDDLYLGQAINQGRISAFVSLIIDGNVVTVDGSNDIQETPYSGLTKAKFYTHLGLATETEYAEINTSFSTADVRGDGVASMLVVLDNETTSELQLKNFPDGRPKIKALFDASVVFDWNDSSQDRDDDTTWTWSDNPVRCLADYVTSADGAGEPWAKISGNLAEWTTAADVCDESIATLAGAGGESLYRIALTYYLPLDRPKDVIARILATFDGRLWTRRDGTLGIQAGRFVAPTVTITDDHITFVELTRGQDPMTAIEGVRAQYTSPDHDYREQDAEPWPDGETVLALVEDRVAGLGLLEVPSHSQVRRLMKREAVRAAAPWRGTIRTNFYGLKARDERFVRLEIAELGIATSFEVTKHLLDVARGECELEVIAVDETIDAWTPATEEGTAPVIPAGLVAITVSDHTNFDGNLASNKSIWFDGNTVVSSADCSKQAANLLWAGVTFATGKAFGKAIIYGSSNKGLSDDPSPSVTVSVRGKNGAAPTAHNDGTELGTTTVNDSNGIEVTVTSTDTATKYVHYWWVIEPDSPAGDDDLRAAEVSLWEHKVT